MFSNQYCHFVLRHGARIPNDDDVLNLQVTLLNASSLQSPSSNRCEIVCLNVDMFASMWICLPQEGLPSIRDEIEAAWLEGRGQLTDEQVF